MLDEKAFYLQNLSYELQILIMKMLDEKALFCFTIEGAVGESPE